MVTNGFFARWGSASAILVAAMAACADGPHRAAGTPVGPSAITSAGGEPNGTSITRGAEPTGEVVERRGPDSHGLPASRHVAEAVEFPPRDGTFQFRQQLEIAYRDMLRRTPTTSFVDIEGSIVWTQEYLRYRVNGCGHQDAITRVTAQIQGRGVQPICVDFTGATIEFPPRNEPFAFRQELERLYRDELRRNAVQTFVDAEGDIVWTQEYLRYRLNGCAQTDATDRVLTQVSGGPVQPTCAGSTPTPPIASLVTNVTAPGATTTLINSPRPNAGAGPIITPSSSGAGLITLTASQPVDRIIVSVNTTSATATRLEPLVVLNAFYELRLSSPQTVIQLSVQGSGSFNLEFAASLGGGALGPYQPQPFQAGPTANVQIVHNPNPVPWSGAPLTGFGCAGFANTWFFTATLTETAGVGVTITTAANTLDSGAVQEVATNIPIPARGAVTINRAFCFASPGQHTIQTTFRGTDANGRPVSFVAPTAVLAARP